MAHLWKRWLNWHQTEYIPHLPDCRNIPTFLRLWPIKFFPNSTHAVKNAVKCKDKIIVLYTVYFTNCRNIPTFWKWLICAKEDGIEFITKFIPHHLDCRNIPIFLKLRPIKFPPNLTQVFQIVGIFLHFQRWHIFNKWNIWHNRRNIPTFWFMFHHRFQWRKTLEKLSIFYKS